MALGQNLHAVLPSLAGGWLVMHRVVHNLYIYALTEKFDK